MKVLIMSHNPITDYNSMGKTFLGLFSAFSEEELCQFYVYPTLPNVKVCKSYYRITDREALRSIICRNNVGRRIFDSEINRENTLYETESCAKIYRAKGAHKELKIFIRDAIWKLSAWKNCSFFEWLTEEKPDLIFAAPGASGFFYWLILSVAKKLQIPIVTYVCDDFYFSNEGKRGLGGKLYAWYIRRKIKMLIQSSEHVVSISEELAQDYKTEFGCESVVISTGTKLKQPIVASCGDGKIISYFGNLQLGRYASLAKVAQVVDAYNFEFGGNTILNIYTADQSNDISAAFAGILCVRYCGFLTSDEMYNEMKKASVLIHVESFEQENRKRVKYSVSTKIPDSLASGICLFAYGPEGISSIEYLKRNDSAFVATDEKELKEQLLQCLNESEIRAKKISKALEVAVLNHNSERQSKRLKSILEKVLYESITSQCRI